MTKKGFTIAEITIALIIIGILATILIPVLSNSGPNKEHLMFRKVYNLVSNTVYELVNDEELYPDPMDATQLYNLGNTIHVTEDDEEYEGETKFCNLMISRMNIASDTTGVCVEKPVFTDGQLPDGQFSTSDGIEWILPISKFDELDKTYNYPIYVDVNGNNSPNCFYNEKTCEKPDRFTIFVRRNGKLLVTGTKEIEYLENTNVTNNK